VKSSAPGDPLADIFVSYSRADQALVAPLVASLEAEGWSVWWDSAITPGEEFDPLRHHLRFAKLVQKTKARFAAVPA
jgi:hypothetical protein